MTSADFAILDAADPWGEERADIRAGLQTACAGVKGAKVKDVTLHFERNHKHNRAADIARMNKAL